MKQGATNQLASRNHPQAGTSPDNSVRTPQDCDPERAGDIDRARWAFAKHGLYATVALLIFSLFTNGAQAYHLAKGPQPALTKTFYINQDCPAQYRDGVLWAMDLWNFYGARFKHGGDTSDSKNYNSKNTVDCLDPSEYESAGYSFLSFGRTHWWHLRDEVVEFDIVFNLRWHKSCTFLHELGHGLGISHSEQDWQVMSANGCWTDGLKWDDIAGIAALYKQPANCTPYVTEDREMYFPYLEGQWMELEVSGVTSSYELVFSVASEGESTGEVEWECPLSVSGDSMEGQAYYQGELLDFRMEADGDDWVLVFYYPRLISSTEP